MTGNTKNVLLSKTFWGAVIGLLPQAIQLFGWNWPDGLTEQIMGAIGTILVIFGRFTADSTLTIMPQKP